MKYITTLLGEGEKLNAFQMSTRIFVLFFVTLLLLRIAGVRTFSKRSAFDNIIMIMLGAIMSRAVVGSSPLLPVIAACFTLVIINRFVAWLCACNNTIEKIVKGKETILYDGGGIHEANRKNSLISHKDISEGLRIQINTDSLRDVRQVILERNGEISVVKTG